MAIDLNGNIIRREPTLLLPRVCLIREGNTGNFAQLLATGLSQERLAVLVGGGATKYVPGIRVSAASAAAFPEPNARSRSNPAMLRSATMKQLAQFRITLNAPPNSG